MMRHIMQDSEEDIQNAFRVFDKFGKGIIYVTEIRRIMESLNDDISAEDIDSILGFSECEERRTLTYTGKFDFCLFFCFVSLIVSVT